MSALEIRDIRYSFGKSVAIDEINLSLQTGEFFCLLGPSGCGKTTLLRLIGGYLMADQGEIALFGRSVTRKPPEQRGIGMVFQNYALFPHLTVRENVGFGLDVRKVPKAEQQQRIEEALDRVGLAQAERSRYPNHLSGGQQQRVALARALVIQPKLLLLDEPFANLDRQLRERLRTELREIQQCSGVTAILVTHDQDEAHALADRVGLMLNGRFLQVDAPLDLYQRPQSPFVAQFVGEANLFQVVKSDADRLVLNGGISFRHGTLPPLAPGDWILFRPEHTIVGSAAASSDNHWEGRITHSTFLGADHVLEVEVEPGTKLAGAGSSWYFAECSSR